MNADAPAPAPTSPRLSVLDLVPVRTGQSSPQALAASLALVRRADELGFERYWFAEHHNMPAVAASTPPAACWCATARALRCCRAARQAFPRVPRWWMAAAPASPPG